jgi:hypothetical protein
MIPEITLHPALKIAIGNPATMPVNEGEMLILV